ncbi:xanthine phosphoribosyltransferase [Desulfobaculum xiamenense]|uniref:Xanthine phosphoribosyltransferase n=1 Tax=Desulfobaculum xiamenense TaxID=995050 RepID=A0A846QQT1_9BACT|nr:xanthine phosphoribosyltransferase [Desulfobaculum xiamenense]NJB68852.1 xanthine phosphoribosyltransferase [Desulfobaculum xiamenense]
MTKKSDRYCKMYPVSWEQLHRDGKALAWRLIEHGPFEGIIAVTRGGLVPAAIIARELDIHHIDTICISSYDWKEQGKVNIIKGVEGTGKGWLIIDDLVDTGGTARIIRGLLPEAHFATIYAKPSGKPTVDTYITEVSQDTWVLFPWDAESRFAEPLIKVAHSED